jgi:hypothetical protein
MGYLLAGVVVAGLGALAYMLRRLDRDGRWDKEGHGPPEHPSQGLHYRGLEVPAPPPFD